MNDIIEPEVIEVLPLVLPTVEPNDKQKKLDEVRDKVNSLQQELDTNELLTKSHGRLTLNVALKCGELLSECSENFEYEDGWKKWVKENIHVKYETVRHYIRLWEHHNKCMVEHVPPPYSECHSLREAYIICGVVKVKIKKEKKGQPTVKVEDVEPEPEDGEEPEEEEIVETTCDTVKRLTEQLLKVVTDNKDDPKMGEVIKLLSPIVNIYNEYTKENEWFETSNN